MDQLTGLDTFFLAMETPGVFGHGAGLCVLEPATASKPLTLHRLTELVDERLHLAPALRRRLVWVPLGLGNPYWVDDSDLELDYHIRELALPPGADERKLWDQVARLHARHLDRQRPLWELYLIHGLLNARQALYFKVHHAAVDGIGGNDILTALLDVEPAGRRVVPVQWKPAPRPSGVGMLAREVAGLARQPGRAAALASQLARAVPAAVSHPSRRRIPVIDSVIPRGATVRLSDVSLRAPSTPFNKAIGPHRKIVTTSLRFEDVRAVKNVLGITVNDVIMAACAGALRRWLAEAEALPDGPLLVAVPVSTRPASAGNRGANQLTMMIAILPTHVADPVARARATHDSLRGAKETYGALPASLLFDAAQFGMPALAAQAFRLAARLHVLEHIRPFNLIISNVPGPAAPLYCAGNLAVAYYPISQVIDGQGLNITVLSYGGCMNIGLLADRDVPLDLEKLARLIVEDFDDLSKAVTVA